MIDWRAVMAHRNDEMPLGLSVEEVADIVVSRFENGESIPAKQLEDECVVLEKWLHEIQVGLTLVILIRLGALRWSGVDGDEVTFSNAPGVDEAKAKQIIAEFVGVDDA